MLQIRKYVSSEINAKLSPRSVFLIVCFFPFLNFFLFLSFLLSFFLSLFLSYDISFNSLLKLLNLIFSNVGLSSTTFMKKLFFLKSL